MTNDNSPTPVDADSIVDAAQNMIGSNQYRRYGLINGVPSGQAKDHQFIGDVLENSGASVGAPPENRPSIADWADPSATIPHWPVVSGPAQAGDVLATADPKPTSWYYAPGGQSIGVATGNETSIGIQDNDRVRESAFGFLDGHDPVVRRYDLLSNPAQPQNDNPGNSGAPNPSTTGNPARPVAANDNDDKDYTYCLGQCSELAMPTGDFGWKFTRCMAQCLGRNSYPEWKGVFE